LCPRESRKDREAEEFELPKLFVASLLTPVIQISQHKELVRLGNHFSIGSVVILKRAVMGWAHATNTLALFKDAMDSSMVTSIECDVLMSIPVVSDEDVRMGRSRIVVEPILSHPPHRNSDLTVATALSLVAPTVDGQKILQKHLKLDFKEIQAVQPTFDKIHHADFINPLQKILTLNADILPGPGRRGEDPSTVPPSCFLDQCVDFIESSKQVLFDG
jgi:hypothetical protein